MFQVTDLDEELRIQPLNKQFKFTFKKLMDADTEVEWMIDMRNRLGQVTQIFTQSYKFNTIAPLPEVYALHQNYPNPFNPETRIYYDIPESGYVSLIIYDILGRELVQLVNQNQSPGRYNILWKGEDASSNPVSSGIYFYQLNAGRFSETKKMVISR